MAEVRYRFVASDVGSVLGAFKSVTNAALESARAATRTGKAQADATRIRTTELKQEAAIAKKQVAMQVAASSQALRESRRAGAEFDRKLKAQEREATAFDKNLRRKVAADDAAERKRTSASTRETEKRERNERRAVDKRILAEQRASERVTNNYFKTLGRVGSFLGHAALTGAGIVGGASAGVIGGAARESLQLQTLANRVSISGRGPGEAFVNSTALRHEFEKTAFATPGISAQSVGEAVQAFVSLTGDLKTARTGQGVFATAASAFGANSTDIAEASASLSEKFDLKSLSELQDSIAMLGFQGKQGAFEIKDMAIQFQRLASAADAFDIGKGSQAVAVLGGISQIARKGTGNARQATTAVEQVFAGLTSNRSSLESQGIKFTTRSGSKRNIRDILIDTIAKTGGTNMAAKEAGLLSIFGRQGIRAVNPLYAAFSHAAQGTHGSDAKKTTAGIEALNKVFNDSIRTTGTWDDVLEDAAQAQKDTSAIISHAWETVVATVGEELTPKIAELASKFADVTTQTDLVNHLVTVFVALAEAAELVVKFFQMLGVLNPKAKSPHEQLAAKQKELDQLNGSISKSGVPTAADVDKRTRLEGEIAAIGETIAPSVKAGGISNTGAVFSDMSHEQFVANFAKGGTAGEQASGQSAAIAEQIARELEADPNRVGELAGSASTPEQKKAMEDFAVSVTSKQTLDMSVFQKDVDTAATAATRFAMAADKLGAPTAGNI